MTEIDLPASEQPRSVAMLNLAVPLQEAILMGRCDLSERQLRRAYAEPHWDSQVGLLGIRP